MTEELRTSDLLSRLKDQIAVRRDNPHGKFIAITVSELAALVKCAEALPRFAAMDRPDCDLAELACSRGIASDMTILVSRDFRRAAEALAKLEAL